MTLDQLRIFVAVAERQHVTQAAAALHLTQSAVSAAIATLERQYSVKLFSRVGRGVALTDAGAIFVEEARTLLAHAQSARISLMDLGRETRGVIRVHASQTVASYWLPPYLVALHDLHPGIEIRLDVGNTSAVARAVQDAAADIGFVEGEIAEADLVRHVVASDELVMVVSSRHPWSKMPSVSPEHYRSQTWILREVGSGTRSAFAAHLQLHGMTVDDLDVMLDLPSNEAILAAVAGSTCVTVMSRRAAAGAASGGAVSILALPGAERSFVMLLQPGKRRTRAVEALRSLVTGGASAGSGG